MFVFLLITYDVNTETPAGCKRLRRVAKECVNYGQRVQNSVFECQMDAAKAREVKDILEKIIDPARDSIRFYNLGDHYDRRITHLGKETSFDVTDPLII